MLVQKMKNARYVQYSRMMLLIKTLLTLLIFQTILALQKIKPINKITEFFIKNGFTITVSIKNEIMNSPIR